jgi:hypothetical protein
MLLSALGCTVAMICIKIVHVVEVLRVRVRSLVGVKPSVVVTSRERSRGGDCVSSTFALQRRRIDRFIAGRQYKLYLPYL